MERRCVTSHRLRRLARIPRRYRALPSFAGLRFIPVRAGHLTSMAASLAKPLVHPRARGAASFGVCTPGPGLGTSPRARGGPRAELVSRLSFGHIPAWAG